MNFACLPVLVWSSTFCNAWSSVSSHCAVHAAYPFDKNWSSKLCYDLWPCRWSAVSCQRRGGWCRAFLTTEACRRPAPTSCHASSSWRWVLCSKGNNVQQQQRCGALIRRDWLTSENFTQICSECWTLPTKGSICPIYPDVTSIFMRWCLYQLCAWLSVKAGRDEELALNSAGVGDFGNRWELGSHWWRHHESTFYSLLPVNVFFLFSSFSFFRHFTRFSRQISNNERHLGNCVN